MTPTDLTSDPPSDLAARRRDVELGSHRSSLGGWGLVFFALFWNAITWTALTVMWASGDVPVFVFVIVGLFVLIGLFLIVVAIHNLMALSRLHPPRMTVSVQPLCIGEAFSGTFVQQAKAAARIETVTVKLVCRERATYRHGTDTTTVTHDVFTDQVTFAEEFQADPLHPIEGEFRFQLSDDAMHSFSSSDNEILWLLEAHTAIAGWPDYKAEYVVDVIARRAPQETV